VKAVATEGKGITELATAIANYQQFLAGSALGRQKKIESWRERLITMLREALLVRVLREELAEGDLTKFATQIAEHKLDPYTLVEKIAEQALGTTAASRK
jgi:LAO/AO transport system kinase